MMRRFSIIVVLVTLCAVPAQAADPDKPRSPGPDLPSPPPIPDRESGPAAAPAEAPESGLEPEIHIITRETEIREEYRVNGRLFKIKVTPKHGKPYYLIDYEGSGVFRRSELEPATSVPMWVIKRW